MMESVALTQKRIVNAEYHQKGKLSGASQYKIAAESRVFMKSKKLPRKLLFCQQR